MFAVGDKVVCVIDGKTIRKGQVAKVSGLRLSGPSRSLLGPTAYGLFLEGFQSVGYEGSYDPSRFRKIQPCDPEFIELLNRIKPKVDA